MHNERTPLRSSGDTTTHYVFMENPNRAYRKKIREFQCCICASLVTLFSVALVITFTYWTYEEPDVPGFSNDSVNTLLTMSWPVEDEKESFVQTKGVGEKEFQQALSFGLEELNLKDDVDDKVSTLISSSPSYKHQQAMRTNLKAIGLARIGYAINKATENITKAVPGIKAVEIGRRVPVSPEWLPGDWCDNTYSMCAQLKYRTIDGSCNNRNHPLMWGVGFRPFRRILPPEYCDGMAKPRCSSNGKPLPAAREISLGIHRPDFRYDHKFTVMLAVWGQFIDHDITATALSKGKGGASIACCDKKSKVQHPDCFPLDITEKDDYYRQFNVTCMEFVRSAPSPTCTFGFREQMNQVSSFLDGSVVYGNTEELAATLREFKGGALKMSTAPDGRPLLPISVDLNDGCNRAEENAKGRYCFESGDPRANENIHLTSLHLLMARQHNHLAKELSRLNPEWDDETIYQEARRIVSAQMQHITYNEFLPIIMGPSMWDGLKLSSSQDGYHTDYRSDIDPSISNVFATAAFRFAHTLIPGLIKVLTNESYAEYSEMHTMLFNPYSLYKSGSLDNTLNGAIATHLERSDNYFSKELTQRLFESPVSSKAPKMCGLDLVSLNIQRGRDHGLPGFTKWRKLCGLSKPKSFSDLRGQIDEDSLDRISKIYRSIDDVDVYTGALSEIPIAGAMLGPTAMCLIGDQFKRLKIGDRFWYETNELPQAFTTEQLKEIRKTTLAGIICDNADEVTKIQPFVMRSKGSGNEKMTCAEIPKTDLTHWEAASLKTSFYSTEHFKLNVTSGTIKINSSEWLLSYPLSLPKSLSHQKVVWKGLFSLDKNSQFSSSGTFSLVRPNDPGYVERTGTFDFHGELSGSSMENYGLRIDETYETYIVFNNSMDNSFIQPSYETFSDSNSPYLLIVLDVGKTDKGNSWNGQVKLIVQKYIGETINKARLTSKAESLKTSFYSTERVKLNVASGTVRVNGSEWQLSYPLSLPKSLSHQKVVWKGLFSLDKNSKFSSSGTFSLVRPNDPGYVERTGTFNFDGELTGSSMENYGLSIDETYETYILFNNSIGSDFVQPSYMSFSDSIDSSFLLIVLYVEETDMGHVWNGQVKLIVQKYMGEALNKARLTSKAESLKTSFYSTERVKLNVASGTVRVNGSEWPLSYPLSLPKSLSHQKVVWKGLFSLDKNSKFSSSGTFSLVRPNDPGYVERTGTFNFDGELTGSSMENYGLSIDETYETYIVFNNSIGSDFVQPSYMSFSDSIDSSFLLIVLYVEETDMGHVWNGQVKLIVQKYMGEALNKARLTSKAESLKTSLYSTERVKLNVASGTVRVNGSEWQLSYPLSLPKSLSHQKVVWKGLFSLDKNSKFSSSGTFSLVRPNDPGYVERTGTFDFHGELSGSSMGNYGLSIDETYKTYILFNNSIGSDFVQPSYMSFRDSIDSSFLLIVLYVEKTDMGHVWNGQVKLIVQKYVGEALNTAKLSSEAQSLKTSSYSIGASFNRVMSLEKLNLGVNETYVEIVGGLVRFNSPSFPSEIWPGNLPMSFPTKYDVGMPIVWSPTTVTSSKISGTFSIPKYAKQPTQSHFVDWLKGDFTLDYKSVEGAQNTVMQGSSYISRIIFVEIHPKVSLDMVTESKDTQDKLIDFVLKGQEVLGKSQRIPLLLVGSFSPNGLIFTWNGGILLKSKSRIVASPNKFLMPQKGNTSWLKHFIAAHISSGYITLDQMGTTKTISLDKFPLPINIPVGKEKSKGSLDFSYAMWSASVVNNTVDGSFEIPMHNSMISGANVNILRGTFKLNLGALWKGSLNEMVIHSKKYYSKIILEDEEVSNNAEIEANIENYEVVAPLILQGMYSPSRDTFFWSGNFMLCLHEKLNFILGAAPTHVSKGEKKPNKDEKKKTKNKLDKKYLAVTVTDGVATGSLNGGEITNLFTGELPFTMHLDNILDKESYQTSVDITWSVSQLSNDSLSGTFSMPTPQKESSMEQLWKGNFSIKINPTMYSSVDIIKPQKVYTCNLLFQANKGSESLSENSGGNIDQKIMVRKTPDDRESCTLIFTGTYYERSIFCVLVPWWCSDETLFYWNGHAELMIRTPMPGVLLQSVVPGKKNEVAGNTSKRGPPNVNDYVYITVNSGSMVGRFDNGDEIELFDGTLPKYIYIDTLIDAKSYAKKGEVVWSLTSKNETLEGKFKIPEQTNQGNKFLNKYWQGNFSVQVTPKWYGKLDFLDTNKEYSCQLFFKSFEKAEDSETIATHLSEISPGDKPSSCSVTMVGTFYKPSFLCSIFPWWCTKETIFIWSGDISLSIKKAPPYENK